MRVSYFAALLGTILGVACLPNFADAQNRSDYRIATASPAIEQKPKFTFMLFFKENDAATQSMAEGLKGALSTRMQRAEWTSVNVNDASQRAVVDRYHVDRAPMPMVLCVAPNGAVMGAIPRQISDQAVEHPMATPAMTEATKALQEKRFAVIHLKPDPRLPLPAGAAALMADPMFRDRTTEVDLVVGDAEEARFLREMEIRPETVTDSMVVILAPPGVLVGKFPSTATEEQIAEAIHAAGKCCNDPNCKYNQKGN
jgi:hypothetical protein